jgi:hypothetical protein
LSLVSDIPAGDGKIGNPFLQCIYVVYECSKSTVVWRILISVVKNRSQILSRLVHRVVVLVGRKDNPMPKSTISLNQRLRILPQYRAADSAPPHNEWERRDALRNMEWKALQRLLCFIEPAKRGVARMPGGGGGAAPGFGYKWR